MTQRIGMQWTTAQLEEFERTRKYNRHGQRMWNEQELAAFRQSKKDNPMPPETMTDGMSDSELLFFFDQHDPVNKGWDTATTATMAERFAQRCTGLTLSQMMRMQTVTRGRYIVNEVFYDNQEAR